MNWVPLRILSRPVLLLLTVTSLIVLVRGHNEPGGGFIGGLLASSGLLVHALAQGTEAARKVLRASPGAYLGAGILLATASGLFALPAGEPFLSSRWWGTLPALGKVGSVLVFDLGVLLVVFGAVTEVMLRLLEAACRGEADR